MKKIHWNKVFAIMDVKTSAFFGKNCIIMPVFTLGFTVLMRFLYGQVMGEVMEISGFSNAYALSMGLVMNICMTGVYCPALLLAEEKEKKTLRVLMTSSVNGLEFFLGSIIPVFLAVVILNFLLIPVSGYSLPQSAIPVFVITSLLCAVTSSVIGMILGIFAKNQVTAGTLITPVTLILMLVPMLSGVIDVLESVSKFLFTGVIKDLVVNAAAGAETPVSTVSLAVMAGEMILAVILFLLFYKRNGFERD